MLKKMSKRDGSFLWQAKKVRGRSKTPQIAHTSPSGQREDYEKYSPLVSAAIRTS